jgi:hypothetical protein
MIEATVNRLPALEAVSVQKAYPSGIKKVPSQFVLVITERGVIQQFGPIRILEPGSRCLRKGTPQLYELR